MDKLDTIFTMQKSLNDEITALRHLEDVTPDQWQQKLTLAMLSEMAEALDLRVCRTSLCDGDVHLQLRPAIPQE